MNRALASFIAGLLLACSCERATASSSLSGVVMLAKDRGEGLDVTVTGPVSATLKTDDAGQYRFEHLLPGAYLVTVVAPSTVEQFQQATLELTVGAAVAPDFTFSPLGALRGMVTTQGVGVSGAVVSSTGGIAVTLTDDAGNFELTKVRTGQVQLTVSKPGYATRKLDAVVRWAQTEVVPAVSLMAAGREGNCCSLRGIATLLGATDFSGIRVTLKNSQTVLETTTEVDGHYELNDVPPGIYSVTFTKADFGERLPQVLVSRGSEGQLLDHALYPLPNVKLGRGRRVEGCQYSWEHSATPDGAVVTCLYRGYSVDGVTTQDQLRLVSVATGNVDVISEHAVEHVLSPDGSHLLFFYGPVTGYAYGARLLEVRTRRVVELMEKATAGWFSPDGATVLVRGSDRQVVAFPVDGGASTQLGTEVITDPKWSKDSKRVLLSEGYTRQRLRVVRLDGSQVSELTAVEGRAIDWSADETRLLLANGLQLILRSFDGASEVLANDGLWARMSRDGTKVYAVLGSYSDGRLVAFPTAGGAPSVLATGVFLPSVAFSPDETKVAFRSLRGANSYALEVMPTAGGAQVVLESAQEGSLPAPVFSPDGTRLLVARTDPLGRTLVQLFSTDGRPPLPLAEGAFRVTSTSWLDNTHAWVARIALAESAYATGVYFFDLPVVP